VSQSEVIAAVLIAGFLVWLAMNQRLGVYWSVLTGGAAAQAPPPAPATGPGSANPQITPGSPNVGVQTPGAQATPVQPAAPPSFIDQLRQFIIPRAY
jgi:hypothetical protein